MHKQGCPCPQCSTSLIRSDPGLRITQRGSFMFLWFNGNIIDMVDLNNNENDWRFLR